MSFLISAVTAIAAHLRMWAEGLVAPFQLAPAILSAKGDGLKAKAAAALKEPRAQRLALRFARAFLPNLVLSRQFVAAYPNTGTAIVTRRQDVIEVLDRNADFEVVYEPKMRAITGGENFFLGMQDTPLYTRDTSNMRLAMRRDDVATTIQPLGRRLAEQLVAGHAKGLDLPNDLTLRVPTAIVTDYFGITGAPNSDLVAWATVMFWYLFVDLAGDAEVARKALDAAAASCAMVDTAIAQKASGEAKDDVLGRCLVLQKAGEPGMDDLGIRNNLIGLFIGAIPTISRACVQALDQLLDRPQALASAQAAARSGDDALLAAHVFEAFRFNPINPLIYRRAARDARIAAGSLRSRLIPKGSMVLAVNLSAMFDPLRIDAPESFRTDRPWATTSCGVTGCTRVSARTSTGPSCRRSSSRCC
jgi:cytochrome P450